MKIITITGVNYSGAWDRTRTTCRGIILENDKILLSYETVTGQWMIPGGGLEGDEDDRECCAREIAEETGRIVEVSDCMLEIHEYYESSRLINKYFFCKIIGSTEIVQTERERSVGMEPRWLPADEILEIFSKHDSYATTDEMRRGLYQREYTALTELLKKVE